MEEIVKYEAGCQEISLDVPTVKKMLVRGNQQISDQEAFLFMKLCQSQKLNPFVNEAYCIKFGTSPAQMVVGYDAYKRRAEENPQYLYKTSGIVVQRGDEIITKEGACVYPNEKLIGGWCRVFKLKGERTVSNYKECSLAEYNQNNSMWKAKTAMMIEKVAISQALRESFPRDLGSLYTREEIPDGYRDEINFEKPVVATQKGEEAVEITVEDSEKVEKAEVVVEACKAVAEARKITQEERTQMFKVAQEGLGKAEGNEFIKAMLGEFGLKSTTEINLDQYKMIAERLAEAIDKGAKVNA